MRIMRDNSRSSRRDGELHDSQLEIQGDNQKGKSDIDSRSTQSSTDCKLTQVVCTSCNQTGHADNRNTECFFYGNASCTTLKGKPTIYGSDSDSGSGENNQETTSRISEDGDDFFGESQPIQSQVPAPSIRCRACGEVGHEDARSGKCKMRGAGKKSSKRKIYSQPMISKSSDAENEPPGEDVGNSRSSTQDTQSSETPELAYHQTWKKCKQVEPVVLSRSNAMAMLGVSQRSHSHVKYILEKLETLLEAHGVTVDGAEISEGEFFVDLMLQKALPELVSWINCRINLEKRKIARVETWEFIAFLGMLMAIARYSKEYSLSMFRGFLRDSSAKGAECLLSLERFEDIQRVLSGFEHKASATSTSHANITDPSKRFGVLDQCLSRQVLRMCVNKALRVTIDDRNIGTVSSSNPINTYRPRKRHKNGAGSDCAACAMFRIVLSNSLYTAGYNHLEVLDKLMKELSMACHQDVSGIELILDRGYPSPQLYTKCAQLGFSLVVVNDTESQQGNPFVSQTVYRERPKKFADRDWNTNSALLNIDDKFVINDNPSYGGAIFSATKSLSKGAGRTVQARAFAVREYGNDKHSYVHRFVTIVRPELADIFQKCYCMEVYPRVKNSISKNWLFYPNALDGGDDTAESDDEFSSTSDTDDSHDSDAEQQPPTSAPNIYHESSNGNAGSGEICGATSTAEDRNEEPFNYSWEPVVQYDRRNLEQKLLRKIEPLTAGQRCADWFQFRLFLVTGTTAQMFAQRDPAVKGLLYADPSKATSTPFTSKEMASMLCKSWCHVKKNLGSRANRALIAGSRNESAVVAQLRKHMDIYAVFEIGLVRCKQKGYEHLGCSADNIVVVETEDGSLTWAPLEIKTKTTMRTVDKATQVMQNHGNYLTIYCGSNEWFQLIPREYRGQLLHQAAVFGVNKGLFCMATATTNLYFVHINYTEQQLVAWLEAFNSVKPLTNWAWSGLRDSTAPKIPSQFSKSDEQILRSRFPLWRAFHKARMSSSTLVLRPVRLLRSLIQLYYSMGKQGVDGADDYANHFPTRSLNLDWERKVTISRINDAVINTCILWRMYKVYKAENFEWKGDKKFREACSRTVSMADFQLRLAMKLMEVAAQKRYPAERRAHGEPSAAESPILVCPSKTKFRALTASEVAELRFTTGARRVLMRANTESVKKLRLSANSHNLVRLSCNKKKVCVVCGTDARYLCETCNVGLHAGRKIGSNQVKTCAEKWHNSKCLN